jgi:hypothetical protein
MNEVHIVDLNEPEEEKAEIATLLVPIIPEQGDVILLGIGDKERMGAYVVVRRHFIFVEAGMKLALAVRLQ